MNKTVRPVIAGTGYMAGAWLFLAGAIISGIVGVYRMMMSSGTTDRVVGGDVGCLCLGALSGIIAAVLALLGIHKQLTVMAFTTGPSYQGSHGSDQGDP